MTDYKKHISHLTEVLGPKAVTTDPALIAPHLEEWRSKFYGKTQCMLMPATSAEAATAILYCHQNRIPLVPQGGNTGLVGGGIPGLEGREEVLISTRRMNSFIEVDRADYSITVDAGCTVAALQKAAEEHDLLFPLSLASEGTCTAGGVASTNAGGVHVLRYGTTRDLTIGVEAVLPTGSLYDGLSTLRKDNTGYNLNQLLLGAEGTLGFITRVAFRLFPKERERHTYWLAVSSPDHALRLLADARNASGDRVSVFEILPHTGLELVLKHIPGTQNPLSAAYPWYILLEVATSRPDPFLKESMETWVAASLENGMMQDGAEAQSETQRTAFWKLRESMSEAQKHEGASIKHDISVPVSSVPAFMKTASEALLKAYPGCRITPFGHLGDGNLHFNVLQPLNSDKDAYLAEWETMNQLVHDIVVDFKGSISAEHGIGTLKKAELARLKNAAALGAMRRIKKALDPHNIMNPGALFL